MDKLTRIAKKKETLILRLSNTLDDILYLNTSKEDAYNKLRYTLELDPMFKNNSDDIDFLVASFITMTKRIDELK